MRLKAIDTLKIASIFLVIMSHVTLYFLLIKSNDFFLFIQTVRATWCHCFLCVAVFLTNNKKDEQVSYVFNKVKRIY